MSKFFTKHKHWILLVGMILSFVLLSVASAMRESLTYDEIVDIEEGVANLTKQKFWEPYNPPFIRELTALPLVLFKDWLPNSEIAAIRFLPARLVTIGLGVTLLLSVFFVTKTWFGPATALLATFLLVFDPNTLAHSHYITMDLGTALFFFLAYSTLLWFWDGATLGRAIVFGVSLGLAMAARVMTIPYVAVSAVLVGLTRQRKLPSLKYISAVILISLFVVWATYFFRWEVVIAEGGSVSRVSEKLKSFAMSRNLTVLQSGLYFFENSPLPLGNYLATVKNSFLRGTQNAAKPQWYELPVNVFLKTQIPLLLLMAFALLRVKRRKKETKQVVLFIVPIIGILGVAVFAGLEPRARYVLPMYPFLAIVAAIGIREVTGVYGKIGIAGLLLWYVVGTLVQFPHFISYANEFVPRQVRYLYFTDSNIDWGQSLPDLKTYIDKKKPGHVSLSYFGRDNGNDYGLVSNREWGSYKFEDICAFHELAFPFEGERLVAISISNWYGCGYSKQKQFSRENIYDIVGDSILIFRSQ